MFADEEVAARATAASAELVVGSDCWAQRRSDAGTSALSAVGGSHADGTGVPFCRSSRRSSVTCVLTLLLLALLCRSLYMTTSPSSSTCVRCDSGASPAAAAADLSAFASYIATQWRSSLRSARSSGGSSSAGTSMVSGSPAAAVLVSSRRSACIPMTRAQRVVISCPTKAALQTWCSCGNASPPVLVGSRATRRGRPGVPYVL